MHPTNTLLNRSITDESVIILVGRIVDLVKNSYACLIVGTNGTLLKSKSTLSFDQCIPSSDSRTLQSRRNAWFTLGQRTAQRTDSLFTESEPKSSPRGLNAAEFGWNEAIDCEPNGNAARRPRCSQVHQPAVKPFESLWIAARKIVSTLRVLGYISLGYIQLFQSERTFSRFY